MVRISLHQTLNKYFSESFICTEFFNNQKAEWYQAILLELSFGNYFKYTMSFIVPTLYMGYRPGGIISKLVGTKNSISIWELWVKIMNDFLLNFLKNVSDKCSKSLYFPPDLYQGILISSWKTGSMKGTYLFDYGF